MLINSVASLMSLTLSAGQTRLIRAPSGLPSAPVTPEICPYLVVSLAPARPSIVLPTPAPSRQFLGPLPGAQLRVYYMMSRVIRDPSMPRARLD